MEDQDMKLRGYLEVKLGNNGGNNYRRLARKCWRRQWVVMDLVENQDSPALIARIYGSHLHEDRNLPLSTITLTDIHALHRTQSRSHQFAFSIDGSGSCITLSGSSETDSYLWMKSIRDILWPLSTHAVPFWIQNNYQTHVAYEVSLIDNVHSDIARLRGFYGHLVIETSRREVLLVEARSGMDQMRWPIKLLKKWFVATKVNCKDDKNKIVVIITHKNSSSGEGIFSFYSPQAHEIVEALKVGTDKVKKMKVNPLKAFFRRSSSSTTSKVKRSTSVMGRTLKESSSPRPPANTDDDGGFRKEVEGKKKSMSESDLLSASKQEQPQSIQESNETTKADGYYRSFDDIDDIDLGVLASSNSLEAAVVLRHKQSPPGALRYSFNSSSDSGRTSDTYAETSNGSVTSSSSTAPHPNMTASRIYSSNSNCSGDSGTQCSMSSDSSNSKTGNLEVLKEQESPIYPPFDQSIYGQSIAIKNNAPYASPPPLPPRFATVRKSFTLPHNINAVGTGHESPQNPLEVKEPYTGNNTYENLDIKYAPRPKKQGSFSQNRPQSLIFPGNASMGRLRHPPDGGSAKQQPVNRTLARLCGLDSAPSTPESTLQQESPRLARFLGLTTNSFSSSTPMDLESRMSSTESLGNTSHMGRKHPRWQSNDGLMTPGSLQCTPNSSPSRSSVTPMRLMKNPLTVAGLAGPNDLLLQGCSQEPSGPDSSSLHSRPMAPSSYRTPQFPGHRFMPRSATFDSLEAPHHSWRFQDSMGLKGCPRGPPSVNATLPKDMPLMAKDSIYMTMKRGRSKSQVSEYSDYLDMRNPSRRGSKQNTTLAIVHSPQPEKFETVVQEHDEADYEIARPFTGYGSLTVLVPEDPTLEDGEEII